MYRVRAWYPLGGRHPLEHYQRYSKRSVPNGDWHNRFYPFRYRLFRLHPLVIHPLWTKARMMEIFTLTAVSLLKTDEIMATPCSVNTKF